MKIVVLLILILGVLTSCSNSGLADVPDESAKTENPVIQQQDDKTEDIVDLDETATTSEDAANLDETATTSEKTISEKTIRLTNLEYYASSRFGAEGKALRYSESVRINTGDYLSDCILVKTKGYGKALHTRDYLLDGQYSEINGTVFLEYDSRSIVGESYFIIWGDNALLYTSDNITSGFLPQSFEIPLNGVIVLRIGFENISYLPSFGISNVRLFRVDESYGQPMGN